MFVDYYCLLQVHPEAEQEIIQSSYKRLCRKYHPDINPSPLAMEKMKQLNQAYEILGDERKRRLYHIEWSRMTGRRPAAPPPQSAPQVKVEVRERVVYVKPEPIRYGGGTEGAYQVIEEYFTQLSQRRYREAYALVSAVDKESFSYGSFVEWQDSVSAIYEIGSVKLKLFKRHPQFKIGAEARLPAEEFTVTITEKIIKTGAVNEYAINKYAVCEHGQWRIYLGYRDLTPLMLQFRTMVSQEEAQMVGVWERYKEQTDLSMGLSNRAGFDERVAAEAYRHRRYNRLFSIVILQVTLPDRVIDCGHRDRVIRYIGYIISQGLRPIDHLAYFGNNQFGAVLAETERESAMMATRRILRSVKHDIAACFDFDIDVRAGLNEYDGREIQLLIDSCLEAIGALNPPQQAQNDTAKSG